MLAASWAVSPAGTARHAGSSRNALLPLLLPTKSRPAGKAGVGAPASASASASGAACSAASPAVGMKVRQVGAALGSLAATGAASRRCRSSSSSWPSLHATTASRCDSAAALVGRPRSRAGTN